MKYVSQKAPNGRTIRGACAALALGLCTLPALAQAGVWGLMLGHNNPAGSSLGLNFLYQSSSMWGFEAGVGGLYGNSSDTGNQIATWGDVDVKWFFNGGGWRGFVEGGLAMALGAGSAGTGLAAGSPFVGGGVLYSGPRMLFHVTADYKLNSRSFYPALGL